ncbi:Mitochondrial ribonuclease P protein 1 -like protein [Toxocara canis]|uniref:RNA (guanine-9-)-methyltransferase domain-containing protein 1 n=1 Tax=Toxocara canis TaxID=6265 RepID=A0A0B2VIQ8_TOXCA|nr:Mitochondrial ribonuclease P protein 1 -like protein [Toxocara canis]
MDNTTNPKLNSTPSTSLIEKLTSDEKTKLTAIVREIEMLSCCYNYFPEKIDDSDWRKLIRCSTIKQRLDHVKFCRRKEEAAKKDRIKEETKASKRRLMRLTNPMHSCTADPDRRYFYLPYPKLKRSIDEMEALRYVRSLLLEPEPAIAIDCQFLDCLSPRGLNLTFLQLKYLIAENRVRQQPWPIYLCNFDTYNEQICEQRKLHLQIFDSNRFPSAEISSRSFIDLFPNSNIVYLSPHADTEIEKVEGNEVFVIGGIVDRTSEPRLPKQASLQAANEAGVIARKLPLDKYIEWKSGSKYLTLTAVASILYDVYDSNGSWEFALKKNIPTRNVKSAEERSRVGKLKRERIHDYDQRVIQEVLKRLAD